MDIHKKPMENNLLVDESCCQKISIIRSTFVYPMIILYTPTFHVYRLQLHSRVDDKKQFIFGI